MFTGIIEDVARISDIRKLTGKWEIYIHTNLNPHGIREGDSIAIDGVCLTAAVVTKDGFRADASLETLRVTTLMEKKSGDFANMERAMASDGRFGGHIVMGHVDGVGFIRDISESGDSLRFDIETSPNVARYIVRKGSVTLDGVSLTVNERNDTLFTVNIIPYTASKTAIGGKKLRDKMNIETDIIGKYIESLMKEGKGGGVDMRFLYEHGYIKGD
ncbi:MAG: riboflavin synthase [Syntrophobacterales bacterium]|jgi:riboflavin synthase|nr:riboflavin synthase [Syntrophobacterales bacterium]